MFDAIFLYNRHLSNIYKLEINRHTINENN